VELLELLMAAPDFNDHTFIAMMSMCILAGIVGGVISKKINSED